MSNVSGQGTIHNLPNYSGHLFTADAVNTPILTMIGGLTGGLVSENFEFATDSQYQFPQAAQPAITETGSLTAPTAVGYVRSQGTNVAQIFQEKVSVSYEKLANGGRMSGLNTAGQQNNVPSEKDFQIATALKKIARDIEYTIINGAYQKATDAATANKTRGLLALCADSNLGGTTIAVNAGLKKANLQALFKAMYDAGAVFENCVLWTNSKQKQIISEIYGYAPTDRNIGGVNIKQIETDFGNIGVALNRFMPQGSLVCAEMNVLAPVFQNVPEKGCFFYEPLAKTGASEDGQIFGKFGLDHGPAFMHGSLTNLS